MKICQLCAVDFTLYHFIFPLIRREVEMGHEVIAVCADGPFISKLNSEGVRIKTIPISRNFNILHHFISYMRLVKFFREEDFDIVHVHTPVAALVGRFAAARAGVRCIVYTAHGFYFHDRTKFWKRWIFITLEWLAGRFTDVLFTQSEEDAEVAKLNNLCRGRVIKAIGNGVDPRKFCFQGAKKELIEKKHRIRSLFDTPNDSIVVVMVGRMVREKGYPELFEAVKGLNIILWTVGEKLKTDRQGSFNIPDNMPNVRILGYRSDIPDILHSADIFILPSHREGMPRSIIEAMMASLPVVATNIRGSREEVLNGKTGILVPVENVSALRKAILELSENSEMRSSMGIEGKKRALDLYDESKVIDKQLMYLNLEK